MNYCCNCERDGLTTRNVEIISDKSRVVYEFCQTCLDAFEWGAAVVSDGDDYTVCDEETEDEGEEVEP